MILFASRLVLLMLDLVDYVIYLILAGNLAYGRFTRPHFEEGVSPLRSITPSELNSTI
jgi:hypothetical protein